MLGLKPWCYGPQNYAVRAHRDFRGQPIRDAYLMETDLMSQGNEGCCHQRCTSDGDTLSSRTITCHLSSLQISCVKSSFPHITAWRVFPQHYSVLINYWAQYPLCIGILDDCSQQYVILARK